MNEEILKNINNWGKKPFDKKTIQELNILKKNHSELHDSFYKNLEFGTGGMRGIMGVGTNRINKYTIGKNTQGISNFINNQQNISKKVVIAFDCRKNSDILAKIVADVFSANGIKVYLFSSLRPTPQLSYAVRKLNCTCGIVLTASHNPPKYNGYKVYWSDGGQIVPPIDKKLISEIEKIKFEDVKFNANNSLIDIIEQEFDNEFINLCLTTGLNKEIISRKENKIIFTALHGTSSVIMPSLLKKAGYLNAKFEKSQMSPDGNFSTVKSPNPEEIESMDLALKLANLENADMVIGTDPDADRLGVAVRDLDNNLVLINGNQLMIVVFDYLLKLKSNSEELNKDYFIASTIVSTPMIKKIALNYNVDCKLSLTGFKWIAKMIEDFPNQKFIAGGEESYGLMIGDEVRDKDAITASLLAYEMMSFYKQNNTSVFHQLIKLYIKYGFYKEKLISIVKEGQKGQKEINDIIEHFRKTPLDFIGKSKVKFVCDYQKSIKKNILTQKTETIELPKSNVIEFESIDGYKLILRPSGTEPKIKMYISVNSKIQTINEFKEVNLMLDAKLNEIVSKINL
jgi:phosphomannomutase